MIMTTTPSIEDKKVTDYLDIVVGEAIMGAQMFRDPFAGITGIIGGRSGACEGEMATGRITALRELESHAAELGANGLIGVDLDCEVIDNMMMVTASGTVVEVA